MIRALHSESFALFSLFFCCLGLIAFIGQWHNIPAIDLPNHIARYHIGSDPDGVLSQYYLFDFSPQANAAVDVIWLLLGRHLLPPEPFANLMMAIYAATFVFSISLLSRVIHGRWSVWPLASVAVVFNANFFWGFQNFLFSVPFAIFALVIWIWLDGIRRWQRVLVFVPLAWLLFNMHVLAFVILPVTVLGLELEALMRSQRGKRFGYLRENIVSSIPFIIPLAAMFVGRSGQEPKIYGSHTEFGDLFQRLFTFLSPTDVVVERTNLSLFNVNFLILVVLLVLFASLLRSGRGLVVARGWSGAIGTLGVVAFLSPTDLDGVALVHIRIPFVWFAIVIAATRWNASTPWKMIWGAVITGLVIVRMVLLMGVLDRHERQVADLRQVLREVSPGDRILPVQASDPFPYYLHYHIQAYAVFERNAFVPTLFQGTHSLMVKPEWQEFATPAWGSVSAVRVFKPEEAEVIELLPRQRQYWVNWRQGFTHVLIMDKMAAEYLENQGLKCVAHAGLFTLFQVVDVSENDPVCD